MVYVVIFFTQAVMDVVYASFALNRLKGMLYIRS